MNIDATIAIRFFDVCLGFLCFLLMYDQLLLVLIGSRGRCTYIGLLRLECIVIFCVYDIIICLFL